MNGWIVLAILIVAGVLAVLVVTRRGPRTADEALGQPIGPTLAASRSGLEGQPLKLVLQALMRNRATGLLTVISGNQTCTIAMLFGHIFHAEYGAIEGEEALRAALGWTNPTTSFNPKAQLPTKETMTRIINAMDL